MTFGNGKWKEGRQGAASLCYLTLREDQLEAVARHHAAVGIRASIYGADGLPLRQTLSERNWHLFHTPPVFASQPLTIAPPPALLPDPLPAHPAPVDLQEIQRQTESAVRQAHWVIWLIDSKGFDALTPGSHEKLLRWLGDHHARIWCAPINNIAAYCTPA